MSKNSSQSCGTVNNSKNSLNVNLAYFFNWKDVYSKITWLTVCSQLINIGKIAV